MNSAYRHTPGPWNLPDAGKPLVSAGSTQSGWNGMIARADAGDYARSYEEGMANARLIAAAPELLNLLDRLYNHVAVAEGKMSQRKILQADLGYGTLGEISVAIDAALAKARGEG